MQSSNNSLHPTPNSHTAGFSIIVILISIAVLTMCILQTIRVAYYALLSTHQIEQHIHHKLMAENILYYAIAHYQYTPIKFTHNKALFTFDHWLCNANTTQATVQYTVSSPQKPFFITIEAIVTLPTTLLNCSCSLYHDADDQLTITTWHI